MVAFPSNKMGASHTVISRMYLEIGDSGNWEGLCKFLVCPTTYTVSLQGRLQSMKCSSLADGLGMQYHITGIVIGSMAYCDMNASS